MLATRVDESQRALYFALSYSTRITRMKKYLLTGYVESDESRGDETETFSALNDEAAAIQARRLIEEEQLDGRDWRNLHLYRLEPVAMGP